MTRRTRKPPAVDAVLVVALARSAAGLSASVVDTVRCLVGSRGRRRRPARPPERLRADDAAMGR